MEPSINPIVPEQIDNPSLVVPPTEQQPKIQQVFSHEKVITPINSDVKPEETFKPVFAVPAMGSMPPVAPPVSVGAADQAKPAPIYPTQNFAPQPVLSTQPTADAPPEWKPPHSTRKKVVEALIIFALAAIAGAIFQQWYKLTLKVLPNSISVCSNSDNNAISFACHGTLFGNIFAYITLFSVASYISYRILKKSYLLAYYYGGLFVALLLFFEIAVIFDIAAIYKLRWLFDHGSFLNGWLIPAAISGIITLLAYVLIKYTPKIVTKVLIAVYVLIIFGSLIFMPKLVNDFVGQLSDKGVQESKSKVAESVKNSDIKLYAPKNYTGPLEITYANALIDDPELIPRYVISYKFPNPYPNQSGTTQLYIYKGSTNDFNPPANCGDGSPSSVKNKSKDTYACKIVLTTKRGREIYGYRSPAKLGYYNIDLSSDDIKKLQPDIFYIPMGSDVISFSDPANNYDNESPLTPEVIEEFVDSLEPLTGDELEQFISKHVL